MMLSYYTKMCIPIIGLNFKKFHCKINVNNVIHAQTANDIKLAPNTLIYYFIINDLTPIKVYEYVMVTARGPPFWEVI